MSAMRRQMGTMSAEMMRGRNATMGGMTGMMGKSAPHRAMGQMADHTAQMLGAMEGYMGQMRGLLADSAVARDPAMMTNLRELQGHMASMIGIMGPMIGSMQRMQVHMAMGSQMKKP